MTIEQNKKPIKNGNITYKPLNALTGEIYGFEKCQTYRG